MGWELGGLENDVVREGGVGIHFNKKEKKKVLGYQLALLILYLEIKNED